MRGGSQPKNIKRLTIYFVYIYYHHIKYANIECGRADERRMTLKPEI